MNYDTFDCLKCGACCRMLIIPVTGKEQLDVKWLEERGFRIFGDRVVIPIRCPHLGPDNKCDIHTTKNRTCKEAPVGDASCLFCRRYAKAFNV